VVGESTNSAMIRLLDVALISVAVESPAIRKLPAFRADQHRQTLEPYRDRPGRRGKIESGFFGRGGFDRAVWSKSLAFATDAVIQLWDFNERKMACGGLRGQGAMGWWAVTSVSGAKSGLVPQRRMRVVRAAIGVKTHPCVACCGTQSRSMDSGRSSVDALRKCHR
jgi:hypothetical protein